MKGSNEKIQVAWRSDWLIATVQLLIYIVGVIPVRLYCRFKRVMVGDLRTLKRGALIASNHQSMWDPFLIVAYMPLSTLVRIVPLRFPTSDVILRNRLYNPPFFPVLRFLGCFSIGETTAERMRVIYYIRDMLARNNTIMLFPEGKITRESNIQTFKQGIDFFLKNTHSVLFVHLKGFNRKHVSEYVGRPQVTFGKVFSPPPQMSTDQMRHYLETL